MAKPAPGPDGSEKAIRLGCGGLVGALIGFVLVVQFVGVVTTALLGGAATAALLCAVLALRYGDRFWKNAFGSRAWPWNWW